MKSSLRRLELATWALIFGGMGIASLGFAGQSGGAAFGWPLVALGVAAISVGIVLIWVRSRVREGNAQQTSNDPSPETLP